MNMRSFTFSVSALLATAVLACGSPCAQAFGLSGVVQSISQNGFTAGVTSGTS